MAWARRLAPGILVPAPLVETGSSHQKIGWHAVKCRTVADVRMLFQCSDIQLNDTVLLWRVCNAPADIECPPLK